MNNLSIRISNENPPLNRTETTLLRQANSRMRASEAFWTVLKRFWGGRCGDNPPGSLYCFMCFHKIGLSKINRYATVVCREENVGAGHLTPHAP
jgi:hypothetical protein